MKLIDLLVQELPKHGGWPEGAHELFMHHKASTEAYFYNVDGGGVPGAFTLDICGVEYEGTDEEGFGITRAQYEAALAASQKPAWNGEGLPPAGCECEAKYRESDSAEWFLFRCVGVDCGVAFGWAGKEAATLGKGSYEFRPLRTEAERNRDKTAEAIDFYMPEFITDTPNELYHAKKIYDAIAAGKIPGVKLDD
ncbi:hypothetical protein [Salmonella phage Akira]|uniref:Uncharacterized protein n=1 Tax=Salmonella phage Akira TaxID=2562461 RepID=A0A4D6DYM3_9CAUD|nr:hypothetical protein KGB47_gp46 [Salmonella phage Akira]QBZ71467.1 hypothetical protein [Salmonella phage Akira]